MLTPPIVYLDSSDYSVLSDPRKRTAGTDRLKAELLAIAASGAAVFAYSGAHLSEMAPLGSSNAGAAEGRAELLADLCGRNAFVSMERLLRWELAGAVGLDRDDEERLLSAEGDWFPTIENLMPSVNWADQRSTIVQAMKDQGLSRAQRRKAEREHFKGGKPSAQMRKVMARADMAPEGREELLGLYPMRPDDAETLRKYVLGHASSAQADAAFLNSLRDPRWMMRWFEKHHDKLGAIGDMLRGPSKDMIAIIRSTAASLAEAKERWGNASAPAIAEAMGSAYQDKLLLAVANKVAGRLFPETTLAPLTDVRVVDESCPGLSVAVRSLHSVLRDAVGASPRLPKESDFVDVAHAMYAPRVSLFRTDRYMAPHIAKHLPARSAVVVPKLDALLGELRKVLP